MALHNNMIRKLQCIQNHTANIVLGNKKFDHVTPLLHDLHWLSVSYRIEYKILLITHKFVHGKASFYLSSLLHKYVLGRALQSGDQNLLVEKRWKLKTYVDRAFLVAALCLRNALQLCFKGTVRTRSVLRNNWRPISSNELFSVWLLLLG